MTAWYTGGRTSLRTESTPARVVRCHPSQHDDRSKREQAHDTRRDRENQMTNLNVVMINVASRDDGLRVLDRVDSATDAGEITVEDVAMVYKSDSGKVKIHQTGDATAGKGAMARCLAGGRETLKFGQARSGRSDGRSLRLADQASPPGPRSLWSVGRSHRTLISSRWMEEISCSGDHRPLLGDALPDGGPRRGCHRHGYRWPGVRREAEGVEVDRGRRDGRGGTGPTDTQPGDAVGEELGCVARRHCARFWTDLDRIVGGQPPLAAGVEVSAHRHRRCVRRCAEPAI